MLADGSAVEARRREWRRRKSPDSKTASGTHLAGASVAAGMDGRKSERTLQACVHSGGGFDDERSFLAVEWMLCFWSVRRLQESTRNRTA